MTILDNQNSKQNLEHVKSKEAKKVTVLNNQLGRDMSAANLNDDMREIFTAESQQ